MTSRWRRIATDWGTRWRPSHSTPGRIAAAKVSARSRRMRTLRTCQIPAASATTASAAAVAFATRTVRWPSELISHDSDCRPSWRHALRNDASRVEQGYGDGGAEDEAADVCEEGDAAAVRR